MLEINIKEYLKITYFQVQCDICPEIFDLATENLNKIRRLRKQRVSSPSFLQPRCQGEPPSLQIDEVLESLLLDQSPSQPPYSSDHASPATSTFSGGRWPVLHCEWGDSPLHHKGLFYSGGA